MKTSRQSSGQSGFTLLELVLAVLLMTIIIGMVMGISRSSLALGTAMIQNQNTEMEHQAFIDLLGNHFSALPGNTRFDLKVEDSGSHYISDLTLQNAPMIFTWGGEDKIAKAVQLSTVKRRSGYLDVVLRYYENEILEGSASTFGSTITDTKPFAEIVLLQDVAYFEWRVLDGRSMEWQYDWDIQGRLPLQVELTMAIGATGSEIRQIFWLPPKQNPEVAMRSLGNAGGNNNTGGGGINIPGGAIGGQTGTGQGPGSGGRPGGGGGREQGGGGGGRGGR